MSSPEGVTLTERNLYSVNMGGWRSEDDGARGEFARCGVRAVTVVDGKGWDVKILVSACAQDSFPSGWCSKKYKGSRERALRPDILVRSDIIRLVDDSRLY